MRATAIRTDKAEPPRRWARTAAHVSLQTNDVKEQLPVAVAVGAARATPDIGPSAPAVKPEDDGAMTIDRPASPPADEPLDGENDSADAGLSAAAAGPAGAVHAPAWTAGPRARLANRAVATYKPALRGSPPAFAGVVDWLRREGSESPSEDLQMPKLKTKSAAKKRFRFTASGKVRANVACKRHNLRKRSVKMKRQARGTMILAEGDAGHARRCMPYG
jgi:large subunit ribosomal protein L35